MGAEITLDETWTLLQHQTHDFEARYELVKTMRASILY